MELHPYLVELHSVLALAADFEAAQEGHQGLEEEGSQEESGQEAQEDDRQEEAGQEGREAEPGQAAQEADREEQGGEGRECAEEAICRAGSGANSTGVSYDHATPP